MNETMVRNGDIVVREFGSLRRITLNRPKALNAVTLDMAVTMTDLLRSWADDAAVGAVLLDGSGERGFCAGGDIRALYEAAKAGDSLPARFWATEYRLNVMLARYRKPVIVLMDGLVMGGGVGLSAHAAHRIVTERSAIAMPETGIGYFPDVGASYVLARAPGFTGTYLELTGDRIGAADAIYCGMADIHIATARLANIPAALRDCRTASAVTARLQELSSPPPPGRLPAARRWIDACFAADSVEDIVARLFDRDEAEARAALDVLRKVSPTSLKITLRNLRSALSFGTLEQSFQQDYRISLACAAGHDFIEGIRAAIVDKDKNPAWRPGTLAEVTAEMVDRHFRSVGALELTFPD